MTTILIVDDSAVDQRLAGGLLEKDEKLVLRYAVNGADALEQIKDELPELVLTDLVMPEMDGLELVSVIRAEYPSLPVILMTSAGNEEICVQALHVGAASYVPKRALSQRLLETVYQVIEVSTHERTVARLMDCMTVSHCAFELENDNALIPPLVNYLLEEAGRMGACDEVDRTRIGVALEESLVNALCHGNLEVGSELRGDDDQAYYNLLIERRGIEPYCLRRIHLDVTLTRNSAKFVIRDEGSGFNPDDLPDPTDPANLEKACGRGVLLMRSFMDEVSYNDAGNCVTLVKRTNKDEAA
jgi:CheY-like chemotaxis protein/anti-sigma regulatory factor (Ser/Thr protein kinase)